MTRLQKKAFNLSGILSNGRHKQCQKWYNLVSSNLSLRLVIPRSLDTNVKSKRDKCQAADLGYKNSLPLPTSLSPDLFYAFCRPRGVSRAYVKNIFLACVKKTLLRVISLCCQPPRGMSLKVFFFYNLNRGLQTCDIMLSCSCRYHRQCCFFFKNIVNAVLVNNIGQC